MNRVRLIYIMLFCFPLSVQSQVAHVHLHQMNTVSGMLQLHSKLDSAENVLVTVSAGVGFLSNSISLGDISEREGALRIIDFDSAQGQLKDINYVSYQNELNLVHVDYLHKSGLQFRAGVNYKSHVQASYTKELFELLGKGNADFVGQAVSIGTPAHIASMQQFYLGAKKEFGNFTATGQVKFISGISHLRTRSSKVELTTSEDIYQIGLSTDLEIETSKILKYNDVDDLSFEFKSLDFGSPFKNNFGLAVDFGFQYTFGKRNYLFINAYDLGFTNWSNLSRSYTSNIDTDYEGLDVAEYFETEDEVILIDSLRSLLQIEETLADYSSSLSSSFAIGMGYALKKNLDLTLNLSILDIAGFHKLYSTVGLHRRMNDFIDLGLSYSNFGSSHSIGLNLGVEWRAINVFFATDCLRSLISPIDPSISSFYLGFSYEL